MILSPLTSAMVLVCVAVCTDLLWRRIPNWLTMPFVFLGFWLNIAQLGPGPGTVYAFKGLVAGLLVFMVPFLLGGAGGGDVKLLGAIGSIVGGYAVCWTFLYGAMAGGIVSLFLLLRKKKTASLAGVMEDVKLLAFRLEPGLAYRKKERECIPYSLPIFTGYLAYVFVGGVV